MNRNGKALPSSHLTQNFASDTASAPPFKQNIFKKIATIQKDSDHVLFLLNKDS